MKSSTKNKTTYDLQANEVSTMFFYESKSMDPAWNLALEEILFQGLPAGESCLYLWRNRPSVIIGKNQCAENEADPAFLDRHGILLVRRLSGGGAVYHDPGNLNYTVIVDMDPLPVDDSFFSLPVIRALEALGIRAVRSGRNDLLIEGKKFGGCAQYEKDGRLLHHGCIMLDTDLQMLQCALTVHPSKLRSHGISSVRSRVTTIEESVRQHGQEIPPDLSGSLKTLLRREFARACSGQGCKAVSKSEGSGHIGALQYTVLELSEETLSRVRCLAERKYLSPAWTRERKEPAEARASEGEREAGSDRCARNRSQLVLREHKYESGLVSVRMEVRDRRIHRIRIRGDFFGSADISTLESRMEGLLLDARLADRLRALPVEACMHGIHANDLAGLLLSETDKGS